MLKKIKNFMSKKKENATQRFRYKMINREEYKMLRIMQEEHKHLLKLHKNLQLKYEGQNKSFYSQLEELSEANAKLKISANDVERYKQDREDFRRRVRKAEKEVEGITNENRKIKEDYQNSRKAYKEAKQEIFDLRMEFKKIQDVLDTDRRKLAMGKKLEKISEILLSGGLN